MKGPLLRSIRAQIREAVMSVMSMKFAARNFFGRYPAVFFPLYNIRRKNRSEAVSRITQLVIEGFPRSANTWTVLAFEYAQPVSVKIAHHLHVPAQIIKAIKLQIPSLVLIRKPRDAVASLLVQSPEIPAWLALRAYVSFYTKLIPYRTGYVVGAFEDVIHHLDKVISTVNSRFLTKFVPPILTNRDIKILFEQIDEANRNAYGGKETHVARPSSARESAKYFALSRLEMRTHRHIIEDAETVYQEFVSFCCTQT
jgi:hypothetical protein